MTRDNEDRKSRGFRRPRKTDPHVITFPLGHPVDDIVELKAAKVKPTKEDIHEEILLRNRRPGRTEEISDDDSDYDHEEDIRGIIPTVMGSQE